MGRFTQWLSKPPVERNQQLVNKLGKTPFRLGLSSFANVYLAYLPDSQAQFAEHPEYKDLYHRFTAENRVNNGGDWPRFWSLILNLKQVLESDVQGDFAELGVWRGNVAAVGTLRGFAYPAGLLIRHF